MEKRYQVFVSSTYDDLQAERQEVIHALLELDCIPAGMELFPAASQDLWTLIREVIADCDYYIVIVAGRYGSMDPTGTSHTEREYHYALQNGKPVIAFLHEDPNALPAEKTEPAPEIQGRLAAFRRLLEKKVCKYWRTPTELGSVMSRSLVRLIKAHPAVGWVRADSLPGPEAMTQIVRLRNRVEQLEAELASVSTTPPVGTEDLARGDDEATITYTFRPVTADPVEFEETFTATWDDVFAAVSPCLIGEATECQMRAALNRFIEDRNYRRLKRRGPLQVLELGHFEISDPDFQTIKVQLRALGLIAQGIRQQGDTERRTHWTLTPYGNTLMTRLRAVRRNATSNRLG